jgi:hypothetical protein
VVIDPLDRVPRQPEFTDNGCWEVNPTGVQLGKRDRPVASLAQSHKQPLLLDVTERHRPIVPPQRNRALLLHGR